MANEWRRRLTVGLCVLATLCVIACSDDSQAVPDPERVRQQEEVNTLAAKSEEFTELFSKTSELILPAVVNISVTKTIKVTAPSFGPEEFFRFPDPFEWGPPGWRAPRQRQAPQEREYKSGGLGSGFVIDAERGYIVTNVHVVSDVDSPEDIKVTFYDGREAIAKEVYADPKTEVALLKVETDGLVALEWADEDDVKVGQWVMAAGSPLGLGSTVTAGIVSATSTRRRVFSAGGEAVDLRAIENPYAVEDYIQTDASINRGNSGGPLVNLRGQVMGVNTLILSSTGASIGLGFAVPVRIAKPVVEELIRNKKVTRGHLGVSITNPSDVTDENAQQGFGVDAAEDLFEKYGFDADDKGALVADVLRDGPADKGGIQVGDLILSVGGAPTPDVDTLRDVVSGSAPGRKISVVVQRKGEKETLQITLGEQPTDAQAWAKLPGKLGIEAQDLTGELRRWMGIPPGVDGVLIARVAPNGAAARAGLQRGDLIVEVAGKPVRNREEFEEAAADFGEDGIEIKARRDNQFFTVTVKP